MRNIIKTYLRNNYGICDILFFYDLYLIATVVRLNESITSILLTRTNLKSIQPVDVSMSHWYKGPRAYVYPPL